MAMSAAILSHGTFPAVRCGEAGKGPKFQAEWIGQQHPERESLQGFIADVFFKTYSAEVHHFCDTLVGCRDKDGHWVAALGFSLARDGRTFLEQYLDAPLEGEIASRTNFPVSRHRIVEAGNLAATHAGAAREMIVCLTGHLHRQGLDWVAFTATRGILNTFARLRLKPMVLANADPGRLPDAGNSWGSYYDTKPQVMFCDIGAGYAQLVE